MNKELYYELSDIEDRLFEIVMETSDKGELYDAWMSVYSYLVKVKVNDLE